MTKEVSIIAESKGGEFKLCPAGSHVARCIWMIDLGTTENNFGTKSRKVRITMELPNELEVFDKDKGEQPFVVSREFTLSTHPKADLRKVIEGWAGRKLTEDQAKRVNITKFLGKPGMVTIVHNEAKNGNTYANISSISPLPKGTTCPKQINDSIVFSLTDFDNKIFSELPDWLQDKIKDSDEYKEMEGAGELVEIGGSDPLPGEDETDDLDFLDD